METILDKTSEVLENHLYHSRLHPEQKIELEWRIKKADKIKTSPRLVFIRSVCRAWHEFIWRQTNHR